MNDNEELKAKLLKLETEIEDLKKAVAENYKKDKKHHKELKALQEKNATWNKVGALASVATPVLLPILMPLMTQYLKKDNNNIDKMKN